MVNDIKFLDKINLQKYVYLISVFLSNKITAATFVEYFLQIRREDRYWMTSSFDDDVNRIMDAMFLDIDEYNPEELYDPDDKFNIDEDELRRRLKDKLSILNRLIS
jgi:beta-N-acetylglucosaminidase